MGRPGHDKARSTVVLIEPAAGARIGHFAEKLQLWSAGFGALNFRVVVACSEMPHHRIVEMEECVVLRPTTHWVLRFMPVRFKAKALDFWTYSMGLRIARRLHCPALGLTASSPLPLGWAARQKSRSAPWGQIVMYGGLELINERVEVRPRALRAWRAVALRGGSLFCNSPLTSRTLAAEPALQPFREQIHHIPDPILVPEPEALLTPQAKLRAPSSLLVPGADNMHRRSIEILESAHSPIPKAELNVLQPGRSEIVHTDTTRWTKPDWITAVHVTADYLVGKELVELFARSKFTLIAYSPEFLQGSANAPLSVVCGTPLLCSRFPYADWLFKNYGKLGELFTYGEAADFTVAWTRLTRWTASDWESFQNARNRLASDVSHFSVVARVVALLRQVPS